MPSSYTPSLRLVLPVTGELQGTWGDVVNNGLTSLAEAAIAGTANVAMPDGDYTLTVANEAPDEARQMFIRLTGSLTTQRTVFCPAVSKLYFVENATTGSQTVIFRTVSGTGITIPNGARVVLYCDGTNVVNAVTLLDNISLTSPSVNSNLTFTGTGNRITGDFSNATIANRVMFQSSTTNGITSIHALPNGTSTTSQFTAETSSTDPANASFGQFRAEGPNQIAITSDRRGTGSFLPMTFFTGGLERMRIGTDGTVSIPGALNTNTTIIGSGVIELNQGGNGDRPTFIDFHSAGAPSSVDFNARLIRNPGTNGSFELANTGTGALALTQGGAAPIVANIGGSERMRINSAGNVGIGTSSPALRLVIASPTNTDGLQLVNTSTANSLSKAVSIKFSGTDTVGTGKQAAEIFCGPEDANFVNAALLFFTRGSESVVERMRITSAGNVGVGIADPGHRLDILGNIRARGDATRLFQTNNAFQTVTEIGPGVLAGEPTVLGINNPVGGGIWFGVGNQTRAFINSAGIFRVENVIEASGYRCRDGFSGSFRSNQFNIDWTGTAQLWVDNTNIGTIAVTSDYRIKQNVQTQEAPAIERVMQLRPVTYEFKEFGTLFREDGVEREGFIAHELAEVIPSAVEGEKDAENQIQSLRLDALCSVLTKAIQEQQAIIEDLKARIAALESAE